VTNNSNFKNLFKPINIGSLTLKNRIVMAPMATGFFSEYGLVTERARRYYEARAKGGVSMVIVESTCIDFPRGHGPNRANIDGDFTLPGLSELADTIKRHGARAAIQLYHAGRLGYPTYSGFRAIGPSPTLYPAANPPTTPHELTCEEIGKIIDLYARAAARAKEAGFDGVEVHAAHGYLISQFLSPVSNRRRDSYGRELEGRARILIEVLEAIRTSVGEDYPLWYRINGREYGAEEAMPLDDVKEIGKMTNALVDAVHVSAQSHDERSSIVEMPDTPGVHLHLATEIKKAAKVPVIGVGRIDPLLGEKAIQEGKVDLIALGRALISDPDLPNKLLSGSLEDIRPCIACFHCSDVRSSTNASIACSVNASVGKESEYQIRPVVKKKRVLIIGGGPAGMETARVLALRGHVVTLLEKEDHLGGQLHLAAVPPSKKELIEPFITFLAAQLSKLKVELLLNTKAGLDVVAAMKPDIVVVATGAEPVIPEFPGSHMKNVVTAFDILADQAETGNRVVVVGGGSIGLETASYLHRKGKEVVVVEMQSELASDLGPRARQRLLSRIKELSVTFHTAECTNIKQDGVTVTTKDGKEHFVRADAVVLAVGTKQRNSFFPLLRSKGYETYLVGDCWHIGKDVGAVREGFQLGCAL